MPVTLQYTKSRRMVLSGFSCDCAYEHRPITQDVYLGNGLLEHLDAILRRCDIGTKLVLVADKNTYAAAGCAAEKVLSGAGFEVIPCLIGAPDGRICADESAIGEVLMTMKMDTEFFLSVGSGAITDIARVVAAQTERPLACLATAPSTDAYASLVADVMRRSVAHVKRAVAPEVVVCDLEVLAGAPEALARAGIAEMLSKFLPVADWQIDRTVNGQPYCANYAAVALQAANKVLDNLPEVAARTPKGTKMLSEALILSGLIVTLSGGTRAAFSVEHNLADFWAMEKLRLGEPVPAYGDLLAVAVATVWPFYARFGEDGLAVTPADPALTSEPARLARLIQGFGADAAARLHPENVLTDKQLARRVAALGKHLADIRATLSALPDGARVISALAQAGCPVEIAQIQVSEDMRARGLRYAFELSGHYNLFRALAEVGAPV
ncbi:MAG: iron-containing alcohol dehydrogenase [Clostridia bacterium]